jgi:hypothetical protein
MSKHLKIFYVIKVICEKMEISQLIELLWLNPNYLMEFCLLVYSYFPLGNYVR